MRVDNGFWMFVAIMVVLFYGDPDLHDMLIAWFAKDAAILEVIK